MNIDRFIKNAAVSLADAGISTPSLDARVILEHAIKQDDAYTLTHPGFPLTNQQYSKARRLLKRRLKGEPVAYITGHKEFYGLDFYVNKNVLVPRPESEWLVDKSIEYLVSSIESKPISHSSLGTRHSVLDMGTGSGCIIISITKTLLATRYSLLDTRFYATDISKKALYVAKKNEKLHDIQPLIRFYQSDLFSNSRLPKKFDLIIANLPYVPLDTRHSIPDTLKFEPKDAIFAQDNGTEVIKRFLVQAKHHLEPNGTILIELDPRNASGLLSFATQHYLKARINLKKDLAGFERYLELTTSH